jgi:hypothetical protein
MVASLNNAQEATMRRFISLLVTEVDFVDGAASDKIVQEYEKHLMTAVQEVAQKLSLRTIQGNRVAKLQVAEIKGSISL